MRTHPHWIMLIPSHVVGLVILFVAQVLAFTHPATIVHWLHATSTSPSATYLRYYYSHELGFLLFNFIAIVPFELIAYVTWTTTYIEISDASLIWTAWPTKCENIALQSIADITWTKGSLLAFIFGYGTIILDAGRVEERIPFVPNVEQVVTRMRAGR